jgi:hypothetical protein
VEASGGILVPAHPFRTVGAASASYSLFDMDYIAAMEVLNGENTERENELAANTWTKLNVPGTAGSDCHYPGTVGSFATFFERPVSTISELVAEILAGRVMPAYLDGDGKYLRMDKSVSDGE